MWPRSDRKRGADARRPQVGTSGSATNPNTATPQGAHVAARMWDSWCAANRSAQSLRLRVAALRPQPDGSAANDYLRWASSQLPTTTSATFKRVVGSDLCALYDDAMSRWRSRMSAATIAQASRHLMSSASLG